MEAALEVIAKKILYKPKPTDVQKIICRRNFPHTLTYPIHDKSWATVEINMEGNRPVKTVTHNRGVWISTEGIAEIDDCPENRERLALVTKGRTQKVKRTAVNFTTQKEETTETEEWVNPNWEILEENVLNDSFVDQVARRTLQLQAEQTAAEANLMVEERPVQAATPELVPVRRGPGRPKMTGKSQTPGASV